MLYSVDSGKYVTRMPHNREFNAWRKKLNSIDYDNIKKALIKQITENDINTSSWMPGSDWTGTVYEAIYHACGDNVEEAGKFFGLILFDILMDYEGIVWGFGRYEKDGIPIRGMTYFILDNPPNR
ncbi:hypothetical protein [Megasphaera sueciensis]|jgi:hypothetical protein|uniref:hypothetical protein n=1 Tax=Megasphaera sueciensis TaxID=349094 RepID=UPI003D0902F7